MNYPTGHRGGQWSIILAGGNGERMRPLTEQWLGYHKPKQFCSFVGKRSLLQHTWDRADQITPAMFALAPDRSIAWIQRGRSGVYYGDPELLDRLSCEPLGTA